MDLTSFDELFSGPEVIERMKNISKSSHDVATQFWRAPMVGEHLTPRQKELIYFAMHASASALNVDALRRQQKRVFAAGGTEEDIVDVLISIVGLANHALYSSVPVLEEEWKAAGKPLAIPDENATVAAAKKRFIAIRGFWNNDRDSVARQMPEYFAALSNMSTESWYRGSLTRKEREFICIGIDCNVTHTYEPGLRTHIRNAIREGATKGEILEIFQLAALMGLEGYVLTAEALAGK
ncbi:MAG: carboxymuconolactone decarboxylase family protein [Mesorhizobium sp.]|nr:MAG: carboxymuconolactone decarboxylase family protein [Mesorhizobium sp.]